MNQPEQTPEQTRSTVVGPTVVIRGTLKSNEDLIIKGRIEAEISCQKSLYVETSGIVKADAKIKSARISGIFVGNITADEKVEIAPDGRVVGDISSPRIIIAEGAAFRGKVDMPDFEQPREPVVEQPAEIGLPSALAEDDAAAATKETDEGDGAVVPAFDSGEDTKISMASDVPLPATDDPNDTRPHDVGGNEASEDSGKSGKKKKKKRAFDRF